MGFIFRDYCWSSFVTEFELHCKNKDLPFSILLLFNNESTYPSSLMLIYPDIKVTTSPLQLMDQRIINMFKSHNHKQTWIDLGKEYNTSMNEIEKATNAPDPSDVIKLKMDIIRRNCKQLNIKEAISYVKDAWAEVTMPCLNPYMVGSICGHFTHRVGGNFSQLAVTVHKMSDTHAQATYICNKLYELKSGIIHHAKSIQLSYLLLQLQLPLHQLQLLLQ